MTPPTGTPLYHVPLAYADHYPGQRLIIRTSDPAALVAAFPDPEPAQLAWVQLRGLPEDCAPLRHWAPDLPIELVLSDPADYPQLYRYSTLLDTHPVRVTLPVLAGVWPAAKLASALYFAVHIDLGQPDPARLAELQRVLDHLLHHSAVQPIEPFYTLLLTGFRQEPLTLWAVQERDPALFCVIDDDGLPVAPPAAEPLPVCHSCPLLATCAGYLRWPDPAYDCATVIPLLQTVQDAAAELRQDLLQGVCG